ncbi:MAG TPA: CcdB family protein [Steroidobacteraceae bacterium]|nr:CcdB family protein [Steroidobacteraceae bacterium]
MNTTSVTMMQFDVFVNPIAAIRQAYPLVVVMQFDFARDVRDPIVAPLVPRQSMSKLAGRLTPIIAFHGSEHVVLVPALMGVRFRDLAERRGSIASARSELLAAIDYLFFGV